jgi:hypothetical protein
MWPKRTFTVEEPVETKKRGVSRRHCGDDIHKARKREILGKYLELKMGK